MKRVWQVTLEWRLKGEKDFNADVPLSILAETAEMAVDAAKKDNGDRDVAELRLLSVEPGEYIDIIA